MVLKFSKVTVAVACTFITLISNAEDMRDLRDLQGSGGAGMINMGGFEITPSLNLAMGNNSNAGQQSVNKNSSSYISLLPSVIINLPSHGNSYGVKYNGSYSYFSASKVDDFGNHNFDAYANNFWSDRFKTTVNLDYVLGHDPRNSLMFASKEKWHTTGAKGVVNYGADGAIGQFQLAAGQTAKRYDTNVNGSTQRYNYDRTDLTGTFFYRVAPATQMIFEVGNSNYTYLDLASKSADSKEMRYLAGVKWEATAKTTGYFKIGQQNKRFNLGLLPAGKNTVWSTVVAWEPKEYSKVNLSLGQVTNETGALGGNFIVSRDAGLNWTHNWTGLWTSTMSLVSGQDNFQNSARVDKRQTYGVKVAYPVFGWLRVGVGYENVNRNSNFAGASYNQSSLMLTLDSAIKESLF